MIRAESTLGIPPAENPSAPIAGKEYDTQVFGKDVHVASRDRHSVTAATFGLQWIPDGPSQLELLPFGALYVWRNWAAENRRFRGTFSIAVNDLAYSIGLLGNSNWNLIFTLNNFIAPLGRSENVEGQRIRATELEWSYVFGGIGIGYYRRIFPFRQDSAVTVALMYEPGYRWFKTTDYTSAQYRAPADTYEGRLHFRTRIDAMTRNLMELPHNGFTLGGDILYGHRVKWGAWGGPPFETPDFKQERTYLAFSGYILTASGLPFVNSEKHRLIASFHAGIGQDLDRFSTFRLPGRPTGYEWEAVSLPMIHGVAFNELFPRHYTVANVQYRYQALFLLYPYIEAGWSFIEQPHFTSEGRIKMTTDSMPTVGTGIVSGAPWQSQIELNYTYNFGVFRDSGNDSPSRGGHGIFFIWSRAIGSTHW